MSLKDKIAETSSKTVEGTWEKAQKAFKHITVEPVMFMEGLQYSFMQVFIEDLQMRRICEVELQQNHSVCSNMSNFQRINDEVQLSFSVFAFYDGIIKSAIPLFFILFMGAWTDKYGRKAPLTTVQAGHVLYSLALLIFAMNKSWPVEYMLIPTFLDSIGGGNVCFLTSANAYLSDITSEKSRTSRMGIANSIYYLGGPLGTFTARYIYQYGGYEGVFSSALGCSSLSLFYVMFCIHESHGPFAHNVMRDMAKKKTGLLKESLAHIYGVDRRKEDDSESIPKDKVTLKKMIKDFFNPRRIIDSFRCTLKPREGNTRLLILLVILCSLIRRLSRSPYVFAFTRYELSWEAEDYSMWVTYKNLMATVGSLVAVPLLSGRLQISDYFLGTIGSFSSLLEYFLYGMVIYAGEYLFWIAPVSALLINSIVIAQRAMLTKFVTSDEVGKVSAVLGALDGVMPMVNYFLFMVVYRETVTVFSGAHFFLGAAASALMLIVFMTIRSLDHFRLYDVENAKLSNKESVSGKTIVIRSHSRWTEQLAISLSLPLFQGDPSLKTTPSSIVLPSLIPNIPIPTKKNGSNFIDSGYVICDICNAVTPGRPLHSVVNIPTISEMITAKEKNVNT